MKLHIYPEKKDWQKVLQRPTMDLSLLQNNVQSIIEDVKVNGDNALKRLSRKFDGVEVENFLVREEEINEGINLVDDELKQAIQIAVKNIEAFHTSQIHEEAIVETMRGVKCWRKNVAIEKIGLYIPAGSAPLFSTVLMLCIPAKLAGCKEIILCSTPNKDGKIHPAILYAAQVCGATKIFKVGGAQAIAAMAYGTETIPKVYKIFGPGNQYVTCAKQLVQFDGIAIDMPAGPSEVCVLADENANAAYVAADLLSQAEHGEDSQVLLVCFDKNFIYEVEEAISYQIKNLPRKGIAAKALKKSNTVVVKNIDEAIELINEYAPEHLIIACKNDEEITSKIVNAGSVFLGNFSPESVGDYASGTNHTLPTNAFAKTYSGISIDSFVKKVTYQKLTQQGLQQIGNAVKIMAEAESLNAHANAVSIRLKNVDKK